MTLENYREARQLLRSITELTTILNNLQYYITTEDHGLKSDNYLPIIAIIKQQITRLEIEFKHL